MEKFSGDGPVPAARSRKHIPITWKELKDKIDEELEKRSVPDDVELAYIDISGYECDNDSLHIDGNPIGGLAVWSG